MRLASQWRGLVARIEARHLAFGIAFALHAFLLAWAVRHIDRYWSSEAALITAIFMAQNSLPIVAVFLRQRRTNKLSLYDLPWFVIWGVVHCVTVFMNGTDDSPPIELLAVAPLCYCLAILLTMMKSFRLEIYQTPECTPSASRYLRLAPRELLTALVVVAPIGLLLQDTIGTFAQPLMWTLLYLGDLPLHLAMPIACLVLCLASSRWAQVGGAIALDLLSWYAAGLSDLEAPYTVPFLVGYPALLVVTLTLFRRAGYRLGRAPVESPRDSTNASEGRNAVHGL